MFLFFTRSAISSTGWSEPISLLAVEIEIKIVSSVISRSNLPRLMIPNLSTGTLFTVKPCFSKNLAIFNIEICSISEMII